MKNKIVYVKNSAFDKETERIKNILLEEKWHIVVKQIYSSPSRIKIV